MRLMEYGCRSSRNDAILWGGGASYKATIRKAVKEMNIEEQVLKTPADRNCMMALSNRRSLC
jgi:hypothetical protein